jgi:cytochrome c5
MNALGVFLISSALAICALVFAASGSASAFAKAPAGLSSAFAKAPAGLSSAFAKAPAGLSQETEAGERIMNASCVGACHDVRAIQTAAMTPEAWGKTVSTMIDKGAKVSKEDVPVLVSYLAQHHEPVPEGRGKEILLNICTMCHDLGRIRLGHRSPEEWEETLVSMLNEGAPLSEEQFPIIHAYLSKNFGIE